jgi:hypothetical protein
MPTIKSLCLAGAVLLSTSLPSTALEVRDDYGGLVNHYFHRFRALERSGEPVEILGPCASSCTFYIVLRNVCIDKRAALGFHAVRNSESGKIVREVTDWMLEFYPPWVREWLAKNGGLTVQKLWMSASYAQKFLPACESKEWKQSLAWRLAARPIGAQIEAAGVPIPRMKPVMGAVQETEVIEPSNPVSGPDLTRTSDEELREIAFDLEQECRGGSFKYASSQSLICDLRNAAFAELDRRGFCYEQISAE